MIPLPPNHQCPPLIPSGVPTRLGSFLRGLCALAHAHQRPSSDGGPERNGEGVQSAACPSPLRVDHRESVEGAGLLTFPARIPCPRSEVAHAEPRITRCGVPRCLPAALPDPPHLRADVSSLCPTLCRSMNLQRPNTLLQRSHVALHCRFAWQRPPRPTGPRGN